VTIREQIVAAMVVALNAGSPPVTFARNRIDSPNGDQLPASTVYQLAEKVVPQGGEQDRPGVAKRGPVLRRYVDVAIDHLTEAETGADAAADPQLSWAETKLVAAGRLGNLASFPADLIETKFSYEQGTTTFCRATQIFRVEFQTASNNPESVN